MSKLTFLLPYRLFEQNNMTQKKDTLALLLALGITAGIVGIGVRLFFPILPSPIDATNGDLTKE